MPDEVKPAEETGKEGAASGEQGGKKEIPFNEHPRWKEVYGELQEFKKLGSNPGELNARLAEANEIKGAFEEAIRLQHAETSKTDGQKHADQQFAQARAQLKQLLPEIDRVVQLEAALEQAWSRRERAAVAETKKVLRAAGLDDSDVEVKTMSDTLADIIKNDPVLWDEYEVSPKETVKAAFDRHVARFKTVAERSSKAANQRDRENTKSLPKAHGGGGEGMGGSSEKAAAPPKTIAEASQRAMQRLRGMDLQEL